MWRGAESDRFADITWTTYSFSHSNCFLRAYKCQCLLACREGHLCELIANKLLKHVPAFRLVQFTVFRLCRLKPATAVGRTPHWKQMNPCCKLHRLSFILRSPVSSQWLFLPKYKVTNTKSSVTKGLGVAQIRSYRWTCWHGPEFVTYGVLKWFH